MSRSSRFVLLLPLALSCGGPSARPPEPPARPGEPADIAPEGAVTGWTDGTPETLGRVRVLRDTDGAWVPASGPGPGEFHLGIAFDEPRQFQSVRIVPADPRSFEPAAVRAVQFWKDHWPNEAEGGWAPVDDDYHGRWVDIPGPPAPDGDGLRVDAPPLDDKHPLPYRVARKVRVVLASAAPVRRIEVLSTARWREMTAFLQLQPLPGGPMLGGRLEFHNGRLALVDGVGLAAGDRIFPDGAWIVRRDAPKAVRVRFLGADAPDASFERTLITVRGERGFTFSASRLDARPMWVEHAGVLVGLPPVEPARWLEVPPGGSGLSGAEASAKAAPPPASGPEDPSHAVSKSIHRRVADEPEQTYERASREIPQLNRTTQGGLGVYLPLGLPDHRQEMCVRYTGELLLSRECLKSPGRDSDRMGVAGSSRDLRLRLPTGDPPAFREAREGPEATTQSLLDDHLPVVATRWSRDGIDFEEVAFATLAEGDVARPESLRGDECTVLCARVTAANRGTEPRKTAQWITFAPAVSALSVRDGWILGARAAGETPVRVAHVGEGPWAVAGPSGAPAGTFLSRPVELEPGASLAFEIRWPFMVPATDDDAKRVADLPFDVELKRVADLWRGIVARGAQWDVPERLVQDFWRANLCHDYINADKDVDTGHLLFPAGTLHYNVCANEAIHQIRSLDLRGHHDIAARGLEVFLACQGTRGMHGRYRSAEGALHGLKVKEGVDYQTFNYNLDHGFVLWMLAEHYRLTGDQAWLRRNAAKLVAACDFIVRERAASREADESGRPAWHSGLLPEGHLEDPPEFHHWYAVNAYAWRGFRDIAAALAEIGSPEAERLRAEAELYGNDLRRALQESRLRAPVVPLRDGRWIPFFPTRCHLRGRDVGWIRDALYGPVHLVDCGVFAPRSPEADWIVEDAEDNVFVTASHGRKLRTGADWFSWGGITIQANLLPCPLVHLDRDDVKSAVRAFYNSFAAHLYADVRAFTEHPVEAYGLGAGPFYKTPDESAWVTWLRYLLIREDGDTLWLAQGAPRGWLADGKRIAVEKSPTYFGPVGFTIESAAAKGEIRAVVDPPTRKPCRILLRLRHPEGKPFTAVEVNGKPWSDVDPAKDLIRLGEVRGKVEVVARY